MIFINNQCYSQGSKNIFLQDENRLEFGNYLFNEKDYLRAIDEYNAYLKSNVNDTLNLKIGYAYMKMSYFNESRQAFEKLFTSESVSDFAKSYYLHSLFIERDFPHFKKVSDSISIKDENEKLYLLKKLAFTDLLIGKELDKQQILSPFTLSERQAVLNLYNRAVDPQYKSEAWAGVMSAIMPGSGKIYAGKISDGIVSFLLTGLFTYLAVDNFNKERSTRAWIFAGTAAFFYAGNIYGSIAEAQIYNAGIRFNFESDVELFLKKQNYFQSQPEFLNRK